MASSVALRRAAGSGLFSRIVNPNRAVSAPPRYLSQMTTTTYDQEDRNAEEADHRSVSRRHAFDPLSPRRSVNQLLNLMNQFRESPLLAASRGMGAGAGARGNWDENVLYLRTDMPGLDKGNVKISAGVSTLSIKGEGNNQEIRNTFNNRQNILRPLSPHLPVYKPQSNSTLSIINRISGAFLTTVVLSFYFVCLKIGLICFTYENFYQFLFYSSKLVPISVEITALALSYHLYKGVRHLLMDFSGFRFLK